MTGLLRASAAMLVVRVSAAGLAFASGVFLGRLLGAEEYGTYSLALGAVGVATTFAALGLPDFITREVSGGGARNDWPLVKSTIELTGRTVFWGSLFACLVLTILHRLELIAGKLGTIGVAASLVLLLTQASLRHQSAILRGLGRVVLAALPEQVFRYLVLLTLLATFVRWFRLDAETALAAHALAFSGALVLARTWLRAQSPRELTQAHKATQPHRLGQVAWPFAATTVISTASGYVALYLVGHLGSSRDAGLFSAALQYAALIQVGLSAVNGALQPRLAHAWALDGAPGVQKLATEAAQVTSILSLFGALVVSLLAPLLLSLYGPEFSQATTALRVLALGQLVNGLAGSCGNVLTMSGNQRAVLWGLTAAGALTVLLGALTISSLGVVGGALSTAAGTTFWNVALALYAWRKLRINTTVLSRWTKQ